MRIKFKLWHIIPLAFVIGGYITFLTTFYIAYFNGYEVVVYINNFKEAQIEFILFTISIPFVALWNYDLFKVPKDYQQR